MKFDFNPTDVAKAMLQAALPFLQKGGQKASEFASHEFQQYIINLQHVETLAEENKITVDEAQFLADQYKLSMKAVMLTIEGLGVIAIQQAVNAAIDVLNNAINVSVGSALKSIKLAV